MAMANKYAQARADFEALERIAELSDQVELDSRREELMQCPTKAKAADLYHSGIILWFQEHCICDDQTRQIAARYNIEA